MESKNNEFKLYYNSDKKRDRETLGYAEAQDLALNEKDLAKSNLTERQFAELASKMDIPVQELVDTNADYYLSEVKGKSFEDDQWLKLLTQHPEMVKTPIAMVGDNAYFVTSPLNLISKDIEIDGIKSNKGEPSESNQNKGL